MVYFEKHWYFHTTAVINFDTRTQLVGYFTVRFPSSLKSFRNTTRDLDDLKFENPTPRCFRYYRVAGYHNMQLPGLYHQN